MDDEFIAKLCRQACIMECLFGYSRNPLSFRLVGRLKEKYIFTEVKSLAPLYSRVEIVTLGSIL